MSSTMKQEWFTSKELASFCLKGYPKTKRGIHNKILRECWTGRKRNKVGGGFEYHISNLSAEAQIDLFQKSNNPAVHADIKTLRQDNPMTKHKYRIVTTSILSTATYELQKYYGWRFFGFWDRLHIEWIDPQNPSEAYTKCMNVQKQLEMTDSL